MLPLLVGGGCRESGLTTDCGQDAMMMRQSDEGKTTAREGESEGLAAAQEPNPPYPGVLPATENNAKRYDCFTLSK